MYVNNYTTHFFIIYYIKIIYITFLLPVAAGIPGLDNLEQDEATIAQSENHIKDDLLSIDKKMMVHQPR